MDMYTISALIPEKPKCCDFTLMFRGVRHDTQSSVHNYIIQNKTDPFTADPIRFSSANLNFSDIFRTEEFTLLCGFSVTCVTSRVFILFRLVNLKRENKERAGEGRSV